MREKTVFHLCKSAKEKMLLWFGSKRKALNIMKPNSQRSIKTSFHTQTQI